MTKVDAVTFDNFNTLRYQVEEQEDIIYSILRAMETKIVISEPDFLEAYFRADKSYRKALKETLRESLLDDIVSGVLTTLEVDFEREIIRKAVDEGPATWKVCWYSDAIETLLVLRKRRYRLGLISNRHRRLLENRETNLTNTFMLLLSPTSPGMQNRIHQSLATLKKLGVSAGCCLHVGDDP